MDYEFRPSFPVSMAFRSAPAAASPVAIRVLDAGGLTLSSLCAVHCAVTPVVLVALPMLGWQAFEAWLRLGAISIGLFAIGAGAWFHRTARPLPPLLIGIFLIGVASLLRSSLIAETLVSVAASAFLLRAHWLNTRACARICHDCPPAQLVEAALEQDAQDRALAPEHSSCN